MPASQRRRTAATLHALDHALRGWLTGTLVCMLIVGTATGVGLWLIGVPLAVALGLLAFMLEFIPYLGPILAAVPGVLMATSLGTTQALYALALYLGIQAVESYLLAPLVYQRAVHVPPALLISAQVIFGTLLGVLGVVFATPLTVCGMVLVQKLYLEKSTRRGRRRSVNPAGHV